jgi:hypothetical protein
MSFLRKWTYYAWSLLEIGLRLPGLGQTGTPVLAWNCSGARAAPPARAKYQDVRSQPYGRLVCERGLSWTAFTRVTARRLNPTGQL